MTPGTIEPGTPDAWAALDAQADNVAAGTAELVYKRLCDGFAELPWADQYRALCVICAQASMGAPVTVATLSAILDKSGEKEEVEG